MDSMLIYNIGHLITPQTSGQKGLAGAAMQKIQVLADAAVLVENGIITRIGDSSTMKSLVFVAESLTEHFEYTSSTQTKPPIVQMLDAQGMVALPGFVDSHTHTVFGGHRANEFAMRSAGKTYQEIAASGGGILSTMNATRAASAEELYTIASKRLHDMLRHGTTTVEIKSGYGLNTASELKMLEVVAELQRSHPMTIIPTFLGAHAFPPEFQGDVHNRNRYIDIIINEMLPTVKERGLAQFCDIFCEQNYFSLEQTERILNAALELGFKLKLHADQLSSSGASELGVRLGAVSVDHLECTTESGVQAIASSTTIATALPGASLFLNHPYPPVRRLIDAGATVALATDFNPGSSMTYSMPMMMTLACTQMQITPEEALTAATLNGATALELAYERGSLEVGKQADMLLCDIPDWRFCAYHFGTNPISMIIKNGKVVSTV